MRVASLSLCGGISIHTLVPWGGETNKAHTQPDGSGSWSKPGCGVRVHTHTSNGCGGVLFSDISINIEL